MLTVDLSGRNHVEGLVRLLRRWPRAAYRGPGESPRRSSTARPRPSASGPLLAPGDDGFEEAVEAGVRDLVLVVVDQLRAVTYTSCEGHHDRIGDGAPIALRHVGVVPRHADEYIELAVALGTTSAIVNANHLHLAARATVAHRRATCEDEDRAVLELVFVPVRPTWDEYCDAVEVIYGAMVEALASAPR